MSQKTFHNLIIECVTGDIVNAANAQLRIGGVGFHLPPVGPLSQPSWAGPLMEKLRKEC